MKDNHQKKVAILTADGFEEVELTSPKRAMEDAGFKVDIVSMEKSEVKAWNHDNWSVTFPINVTLAKANIADYDGLLIPGGVINPDHMRNQKEYVQFAKAFMESGKPVAAICHGPQLLIETGLLKGRRMTSYPSIKTDLKNAGANWVDEEVVVDQGFVTSRSPEDLEAFNKKLIEEVREGIHQRK